MFEGYFVLSASSQVAGIPLTKRPEVYSQHLPGRYAGLLCANSEIVSSLFLPQRAREFRFLSLREEAGIESALIDAESSSTGSYEEKLAVAMQGVEQERYLCAAETRDTGPLIAFFVRNYSLYFWGVSSDNAEILLWSTSPNLGDTLYPNWWVVTLGTLTSHVKVLHTQRAVQRWIRWKNNGMPSSCQRFLALWRNFMGVPGERTNQT